MFPIRRMVGRLAILRINHNGMKIALARITLPMFERHGSRDVPSTESWEQKKSERITTQNFLRSVDERSQQLPRASLLVLNEALPSAFASVLGATPTDRTVPDDAS